MQRKQGQLRSFDKGNKNASKENKKVECFLKGFKGSKDREKKLNNDLSVAIEYNIILVQ